MTRHTKSSKTPAVVALLTLADACESELEELRSLTRKTTVGRLRMVVGRREEVRSLETLHRAAIHLAKAHESGMLPLGLAGVTTRAALTKLLNKTPSGRYRDETDLAVWLRTFLEQQYGDRYKAVDLAAAQRARLQDMEHSLLFMDLPGFTVTPPSTIERMLDAADLDRETLARLETSVHPNAVSFLEPSAGNGDLLVAMMDRVLESCPRMHAEFDWCEIHEALRAYVYERVKTSCVKTDFMKMNSGDAFVKYDRIIMHPPFERTQDIQHIMHAFELLNPGGVLVALVSNKVFTSRQKKCAAFVQWFTAHDGPQLAVLPEATLIKMVRPPS